MPERKYITPQQLSARYDGRIGVRTLANWRTQGNGPPFTKIGGAILYPLDRLIEWEERNTVSSTSQYGITEATTPSIIRP